MFSVWHWSRSSHWFTDPKSESLVVTGADYHMGHQAVWGKSAQGAFTTGTKVGKRHTHTPSLGKTNRASPPQGHLQSPYSSGHFSECPQIIIEDCWFCIFVPILLIWAPSPLRKHTKLKSYFPTLLVSAPSPLGTELPKAQLEAPHYAPPCLLYYAQTSLTYFRSSQFYTHLSHCPPSFNTALILEDPINRRLKTHKLVSSASLPVVESHHFVWLALNSQNRIPIGISKW